ncbi:MAG: hypothetical protein APR53_02210 [Methanoculleus sp. SDB]|nr:MAG: hypothetical protein APR53_02210 [Methanoculleus sp. SDB]
MKHGIILLGSVVLLLCFVGVSFAGAEETVGGDVGWYVVSCNVDGASVYFDDQYMGDTENGRLKIEVYTTATPYAEYSVSKPGYMTSTGIIDQYPAKDETVELSVTLAAGTPAPTNFLIGGDVGYYVFSTNAKAAKVYFDGEYKGETENGELKVRVYITGTPYTGYRVEADGYEPLDGTFTAVPPKDGEIGINADLVPLTPETSAEATPLSPVTVLVAGMVALLLIASPKK